MSELQFLQMLVGSLFGVSMFVKMWKHSVSTFMLLTSSTFSLFFYELNHNCAIAVFSLSLIYVVWRGTRKPNTDKVWI